MGGAACGRRHHLEGAWQLTGISSRSHAWGGTPTFDLSTEILGVRPTGSGFATFQVAPHPVDLAWAEGVVPSPHGDIEVVWRIQEDLFTITVVVPEGAAAEIVPPEGGARNWALVELDGEPKPRTKAGVSVAAGRHGLAYRRC